MVSPDFDEAYERFMKNRETPEIFEEQIKNWERWIDYDATPKQIKELALRHDNPILEVTFKNGQTRYRSVLTGRLVKNPYRDDIY